MTDEKNIIIVFNSFYESYYKSIFNFFKKDFGTDDAEDLTQQTFLQLWQWLPSQQIVKNKRALIYRIAKNVKNDKYRRNAAVISALPIPEDFIPKDRSNNYNIVDIRLSVEKLPPKEQQILRLKMQGMTSAQIGEVYGLSSSAVRTRLQKIRKKLL